MYKKVAYTKAGVAPGGGIKGAIASLSEQASPRRKVILAEIFCIYNTLKAVF